MAMWRPPQRIRYTPNAGRWPTAAQAQSSRLFSPTQVGPLSLAARTWVPAMVPWRATEDGFVSDNVLAWYERFARGRPAAIVVEATGIRDIPSGPLLRIGDDRFLPGLRKLVDVVRQASEGETRLLIQLIDFLRIRRRPEPDKYFSRFLDISARHRQALGLPDAPEEQVRRALAELDEQRLEQVLSAAELEALRFGARERVTDMEVAEIRQLPQQLPDLFAAATRRARAAGFDGVELHYAHAYTMASFLSGLNTREDGYGGSAAARVRLPIEVFQRVRAEVGADYAIGCRMLTEEAVAGGYGVADASFYASELARAGMDFISLSRGGKFDDAKQPKVGEAAYPYTGPSGYECMPSYYSDERGPFGRNLQPAAAVHDAVRSEGLATPIVASGGIHSFEQAEAALADGHCDIVGFARQALADPDWFRKVRAGRGGEVRLCLYTNYCEALDQRHREVTCELWDRADLDAPGVQLASDGKRRLLAPDWREE
jgi:2,4-dienoyl-CoA reductase-like NADH-dependent reductase (Old Yellow Enzyme family)